MSPPFKIAHVTCIYTFSKEGFLECSQYEEANAADRIGIKFQIQSYNTFWDMKIYASTENIQLKVYFWECNLLV